MDNPGESDKIAVCSANLRGTCHIRVTVNTAKWSSDQYCDVRRMTAAAGQ